MGYEPKISSITYVKNGEKYIESCIRSIINQTMYDIEIIVVDGVSTDGTIQILNKLQSEDERIQIMQVEGSVGAQFNAALNIAKGEYIAVCEGDDLIAADKYEKQYKIAKEHNLDVLRACYDLYFEYDGKEYKYKVEVAPEKKLYDRLIEIEDEEDFLSTFVNGFWNGLYSRQFLLSNDIYMNETKGASFQDITFSFLSQMYARRIWYMSDSYHFYRIDNPNSSVNSEKCIQLLDTEYHLLQSKLKERGVWNKEKYMFLGWVASSYKQFADRFPENQKLNLLDKLYTKLMDYHVNNEFEELKIYYKVKEILHALYESKDAFMKAMLSDDSQMQKAYEFFESKKFKTENEMILFGAGHFGGIIYDYLTICKKNIIVVDNSAELQQTGFRGVCVNKPRICIEKDYPIIIANVHYALEIKQQLLQMGVDEQRIILCDNEDFFIREIYMGLGLRAEK